jgi:hypothetical protein
MKPFIIALLLVVTLLPAHVDAKDTPPTTPAPANATTQSAPFKPIVPVPGITNGNAISLTFPEYVNRIFQLSISLSAILAVLVLIFGGFEYMTAEAAGGKSKGMERIRGAITGLLLLLSVYIILNVINPCILQITVLTGTTSDPLHCSPHAPAAPPSTTTTNTTPGGQNTGQTSSNPQTLADGACFVDESNACPKTPICITGGTTYVARGSSGCSGTGVREGYMCTSGCTAPPESAVPTNAIVTCPTNPTGSIIPYCCTDASHTSCTQANPQNDNSCTPQVRICVDLNRVIPTH